MKKYGRIALTMCFMSLWPGMLFGQKLFGPQQISAGTPAVFEIVPAQEAAWSITSQDGLAEGFMIDSSESRIYFASPVEGTYTVVAAVIAEKKPRLLSMTFTVGGTKNAPSHKPKPAPTPAPIPPPDNSLEQWIRTQMPASVKSTSVASESAIVAKCFQKTAYDIRDGTIRTTANALSQLQIRLTAGLALASPTAISGWHDFLTELSDRMTDEMAGDFYDINKVQKVFQNISETISGVKFSECVNGNCPTKNVTPEKSTTYIINRRFR